MKKIFVFAVLVLSAAFANAQSEDSVKMILDNYFENIGGRDAWRELKGVKMSAEISQGGMSIPIETYQMADGRSATKISFQGMNMSQGVFDGETLWGTNWMSMEAEKSESEATENMKRNAKRGVIPFLDYEDKGYTVEYMGAETVEGVECYKLKMNEGKMLADGEEVDNISITYFDQENFVPIKAEQEIMAGELKGQMTFSLFSDYDEVDGLFFAFSMTSGTAMGEQTIEWDEIELNPKVKDELFAFPGE